MHFTVIKAIRVILVKRIIIERRLREHNQGRHSFTGRLQGDWVLIYQESVATRSEALKREKQLKSFKGREFLKKYIPG